MDNAAIKEEVKECQMLSGVFPLSKSPIDVQITIHVNNLINTYGSQTVIKDFKYYLKTETDLWDEQHNTKAIRQFIRYYSVNKMREWFAIVYGWEYEKAG